MRVLIVGASKGIGLEATRQALDVGHDVRALARSATAIAVTNPSNVIELARLRAQARLDVAQAIAIGELRERHGQVLIEARERFDFVFAPVTRYAATKRRQRQMLHDLREHQLAYKHPCPQRVSSS